MGLSIETHVGITKIVRQNENNIRWRGYDGQGRVGPGEANADESAENAVHRGFQGKGRAARLIKSNTDILNTWISKRKANMKPASFCLVGFPIFMLFYAGLLPVSAQTKPAAVVVQKIWDAAPHNAFTDLVRFRDRWFCVFREGQGHVSADGALRVITSQDGVNWEAAARLTMPDADLRDAKITVTPDQRLMLSGAAAYHQPHEHTHQSLVWFSEDGFQWSAPVKVGDPDFWLWRVVWSDDKALGFGYGTRPENRGLRLYQTEHGETFETLVPSAFVGGYPNETGLVFRDDGSCLCLLRRDGENSSAQLGVSQKPYRQWKWKDLGVQIGGPQMIELPDGRLIAGVRLYDGGARTAICQIDPQKGSLKELLSLPSSGDNSYPGLVWHANRLWVSYYSSHEGKTSIYLANLALPDP